MMERTEGMLQFVRERLGLPTTLSWLDMEIDLSGPWPRAKYWELFDEHVGVDRDDAKALKKKAVEMDLDLVGTEKPAELANDLWEVCVEPTLVNPIFVYGYPIELCPLAKSYPDDPSTAMRAELFIGRMEFANMYSELNDPAEQRRRFEVQLADAKGEWAQLDEDFVHALEVGLPPAGGQGLGIDRVVMLFTGSRSIRDVILFPLLRGQKEDTPQT
jgi:lysyl-tRNA synthetase class 2